MRKYLIISFMFFAFLIFSACHAGDVTVVTHHSEDKPITPVTTLTPVPTVEPLTEPTLYETYHNGTIVDARIHKDEVEVILKHFEAIENGDLSAFRDTLFAQDAIDVNHHLSLMGDFFADVIGVDKEVINNAIIIGDSEIYNICLNEDFPLVPRNKGIFVKRIDLTNNEYFNLARVETINNHGEEEVYNLGLSTNLMLNYMTDSKVDEIGIIGHAPSPALGSVPNKAQTTNDIIDRQLVEDFLSQYISLFSLGLKSHDGVYQNIFTGEIFSTTPLVWHNPLPHYGFYDRQENVIEEAIFIGDYRSIAVEFSLYDLDNNGIPTIVIYWSQITEAGNYNNSNMFRFIDGEYKEVGYLQSWPSFFYDDAERLIVLHNTGRTSCFSVDR